MFCNQCEQTAKGRACTTRGVCGKDETLAALQDLLTYTLKGLAQVAARAREQGVIDPAMDRFTCQALFSTLTNVEFDPDRIRALIERAVELREGLKAKLNDTNWPDGPARFEPAGDQDGLVAQAAGKGFAPLEGDDADVRSLQQIVIYGLRGMAAYLDHAAILGQEDEAVYGFIHQALASTLDPSLTLDDWVGLALKNGEMNLRAMELLDAGNTGRFGHPEPTAVPLGHLQGKAILVSGHDLEDLAQLLSQTEGKGIKIYTHGEMLPAHGYPELKKYDHLAGHYGTAWQNQGTEFPAFPGAILMTTNCIQKPRGDVPQKILTTGQAGWPGMPHVSVNGGPKDFTSVIDKALSLPGFDADEDKGQVLTGFARQAVLGVADKVIAAVKSGAIKHFLLVAGCDGAKPGRNYYTEIVEKAPADTVILTLACGKFRFFDKDLGDIGGIPRLLDVGQCNDAYSAIRIAGALAEAFGVGVNDLPLSLVLSWYEQKAVAILLTLLHLGIKDIRLGPSLPAFITPNVLQVLVNNFNIMPITTPDEDLAAILG